MVAAPLLRKWELEVEAKWAPIKLNVSRPWVIARELALEEIERETLIETLFVELSDK